VDEAQRKRGIRRWAIALALVALAFFAGFILLAVLKSN
jgi:hypothetical protein